MNILKKLLVPTRRFGRTGIQMPLLSVGGMRFQQSWNDVDPSEIDEKNQQNLEDSIDRAFSFGLNHVETARHYGTSERQLGWAFHNISQRPLFLQTKVPPTSNSIDFENQLKISFDRLSCDKIDLLAIHGINNTQHLDYALRPGGCLDIVRRWQKKGKVGFVGFSTHGSTDLIVRAIETNQFDYVNLHWYFIRQNNEEALLAAQKFDLGVFIISPTDKGGHLHSPSSKLIDLCYPLHPIVFNDLFCLRNPKVHTISVGLQKPEDLDFHLEAIKLLPKVNQFLPAIESRLYQAAQESLSENWLKSWYIGLPTWNETPGEINIPTLLWLYNLVEAWDMEGYAKARYGLLGSAGHWFPGSNANSLDVDVTENELRKALKNSPWANEIPSKLRQLKEKFGDEVKKRLWSV